MGIKTINKVCLHHTHTRVRTHTPSNASYFKAFCKTSFEEWSEIKEQGLWMPKGGGKTQEKAGDV